MRDTQRRHAEDGAILIHVSISLLAALSLVAFTIDYGVLMMSRGQAQNAADAGALAGASALAFDDPNDLPHARESAVAASAANPVFGGQAEVLTSDVVIAQCNTLAATASTSVCVQVDAYRGAPDRSTQAMRGQPLPVLFSQIFGLTDSGLRATAIAETTWSDTSKCLRPWSIADRWDENQTAPWSTDDTFDKYGNKGALLPDPDVYVAPTKLSPGTGYTTADVGLKFVLKEGSPQSATTPGWYYPVVIPRADTPPNGGSKYQENIESCNGLPVGIGDILSVEPGNMIGPTKHGVQALVALDPKATWNTKTNQVENSCCGTSPRTVAIALYNPELYEDGRQNGRTTITISNLVGFFIEGMSGNDVVGYMTLYPGQAAGPPNLSDESAFLRSVALIR